MATIKVDERTADQILAQVFRGLVGEGLIGVSNQNIKTAAGELPASDLVRAVVMTVIEDEID